VLVPPSVGENGRAYTFMRRPEKVEPAEPAAWLFELLDADKRRNGAAEVAEVIPEGQRRAAMLSVAGSMRRRGLTAAEILPALLEVNSTSANGRRMVMRFVRSVHGSPQKTRAVALPSDRPLPSTRCRSPGRSSVFFPHLVR
jgi:hypothetical protein